jgi:hypothetical protein
VPPADPEALLETIERFRRDRARLSRSGPLHAALRERTAPKAIGRDLMRILESVAR